MPDLASSLDTVWTLDNTYSLSIYWIQAHTAEATMRLPRKVREAFKKTGRTGGLTRAKRLSPARRRAIAKAAVEARWARYRKAKKGDKA